MKIGYITNNGKIPSLTANSVGVVRICEELSKCNIDVTLIIPCKTNLEKKHASDKTHIFDFYNVKASFNIKKIKIPLKYNLFSFLSVLYARFAGISSIHTRNVNTAWCAVMMNLPVVLEVHNYLKAYNSSKYSQLLSHCQKNNKSIRLITTTNASKNDFISDGVNKNSISVIPNGVNIELFLKPYNKIEFLRENSLPENKTIIGFVGSLYEGRGIEDILECAKINPDLFFMIVGGEPKDVSRYKDYAENNKIKNTVFIGHVSQESVPDYLRAVDILLLPNSNKSNKVSMSYVSPMKMFDYLAAGKPIIAQDFPVLREVLHDNINSLLVPPGDVNAISDKIRYLLNNPDICQKISTNAFEDAQQYSWKRRASKILSIHQALSE